MISGEIIFIVLFSSIGAICTCGCFMLYNDMLLHNNDEYLLDKTDSELNLAFNDIYKNNNQV